MRVSLLGVVRSEWRKLWSVRSSAWTMGVILLLVVGVGALISWAVESHWASTPVARKAVFDATAISLGGVGLAEVAIGVLGVLVATSEWGTGAARSTFAAVPRRWPVLLAKASVLLLVSVVLSEVACFAAFFLGQEILSLQGISASLEDPGVARAIVGSGLFLTGIGVMGLGLGLILRRSAGAISTLLALLLVVPIVMQLIPGTWAETLRKVLPGSAGRAIASVRYTGETFSVGVSAWILAAWAVGLLLLGWALTLRRDV